MLRTFLLPAVLTGIFCAIFSVAVDLLLPPLMGLNIAVIAGISGFCGSLFARGVLREHEKRDK